MRFNRSWYWWQSKTAVTPVHWQWSYRSLVQSHRYIMMTYRIMYGLEWWIVDVLKRGLFWCLFPKLWSNEGNKHQNNRWAHKQFVKSVHILLYFLYDMMNPWITIKTMIFTHRPRVSLSQFTFCWWRHNRLLMTSQMHYKCALAKSDM